MRILATSSSVSVRTALAGAPRISERSGKTLPSVMEEIGHLKAMRSLVLEDFPTWPVDTEIRRRLKLSFVFPVVSYLFTAGVNYLKSLSAAGQ